MVLREGQSGVMAVGEGERRGKSWKGRGRRENSSGRNRRNRRGGAVRDGGKERVGRKE